MALTKQIAIGASNLVDLSSTTISGHEASGFPASNLAEPDLENPWRTADAASSRTITFDFGSVMAWQLVEFALTNWNSATTVTIEKSDNGSDWTTVASGVSGQGGISLRISGEARQMFVYLATDPHSSRYVRVTFSGGTALAYYEAYRAFVGPIIQPDHNMQYGWRLRLMPGSTQQRTSQGVRIDTAGRDWRRMDFEFTHTDEAEVFDEWLAQIFAGVGRTGSLWIIPRPLDTTRWAWENFVAALVEDDGVTAQGFNYWQSKFSIEERIG